MANHTYKLTYGKGRGLGEICRLVFAEAGVEYEDERWAPEEFQTKKHSLPFKTIPALTVDGKTFCQGPAISRFLAREFGMMGETNLETLRIEEIIECMTDGKTELGKIYYEKDDTRRTLIKEKMLSEFMPKLYNFLTMRLKENNEGQGFFVGNKLTYADLFVYNTFEMLRDVLKKDPLQSNEFLRNYRDRVASQPNIAAWLKKRPVTEF